jgi:hypothetical protein
MASTFSQAPVSRKVSADLGFLIRLNYCRESGIEMLCLPPHMTHVLQPFDRTVFTPIKTYCHQHATDFMHNNPNSAITKFSFGKFSPQLGKRHNSWKRYQRF